MKATRENLTTNDLRNIQAALSLAEVKGVNAAAQLVVLHQKVGMIIQSDEAPADGDGNSTESNQQSADAPAADAVADNNQPAD